MYNSHKSGTDVIIFLLNGMINLTHVTGSLSFLFQSMFKCSIEMINVTFLFLPIVYLNRAIVQFDMSIE